MAKQNINSKKGFTIIEVVLVLAIAGLIFLMVFVALPALQRSQRDTQRRNDISRVSTSLVQYQTNNSTSANNLPTSGTKLEPSDSNAYPASCPAASACAFVRDYLNASDATTNTFQDPDGTYYGVYIDKLANTYSTSNPWSYASVASTNDMNHKIYILTSAKCNGENVVPDTARHFAIVYRLEGAGTYCLDDQ